MVSGLSIIGIVMVSWHTLKAKNIVPKNKSHKPFHSHKFKQNKRVQEKINNKRKDDPNSSPSKDQSA